MVAAISGDSGTFSSSIKYECDAVAWRSLDRHTQPAFEASAGRATPRGPARHPSAVAVQTPTQQGRPRSRPHAVGFEEAAAAFDGAAELLADLVTAYRAFVRRHPQPYRLMTEGPLPREQLAPGVEGRAAAALVRAAGSPERARAAFAFIHSMLILELNGRFPDDGGLEPAWRTGLAAFDSPALVARPQ
jgi:Tetracyclin repressor-like, C-terminal domain